MDRWRQLQLTDLISSSDKLDQNALEISCVVLQSCATLYINFKLLHPLYSHFVTRTINHFTVKMCLRRSGILLISSWKLLLDHILVSQYSHLHRVAWSINFILTIVWTFHHRGKVGLSSQICDEKILRLASKLFKELITDTVYYASPRWHSLDLSIKKVHKKQNK
jgi:hypothetical protein